MITSNIPIKKSLNFAWNAFKKNLNFFLPLVALIVFASGLPDALSSILKNSLKPLSFIVNILASLTSMYLGMIAIKISLQSLPGKKLIYSRIFLPLSVYANYLIGVFIYTLIVFGGLLFIIPGFIFGIKYKYIPFLIIDKGLTPIEALHKSAEITEGIKLNLFLFSVLLTALNLAGFLFFFIGIFITVPISWLAEAYVYKTILEEDEPDDSLPAEETS